jgi:hypothetical protein
MLRTTRVHVRKKAKTRTAKLPKRNRAARAAVDQKAGPMKDRREGRKGSRNVTREAMEEADR